MPIAASTSARPPNAPSNQAPSRAAYSDVPIVSVIVWMLGTGRLGSSSWIMRRMLATNDAGETDVRT